MVVVADASVAIRGDLSGFESDLKRAESATSASAGRLNLTFSNILKAGALFGIGTSLHQLVQGAIRELGDAATAFSELQQTQRTTDEVFGESAKVIEDWASRSADAAGMSQRTVFQSASVMGQTLINMGFAADEAAEKTVMLQQRASEMAVAFGTTPERAILAITAAMRGERDTIEKFGVSIKQVDVNSRVAALGLDTSTAAAKKNAEAMAILDLVMEQTAGQAGRFADGQDDVAVKMLRAQARIDDFMTTQVGPAVASIQLGAVKTAEFAVGELDKFTMTMGEQGDTIQRLADQAGISFFQMQQKIISAMEASGESFEEVTRGMDDDAKLASAAIAMEMPKGIAAMQEALQLGGPVIAAEAGKIAGMLPSEISARIQEIKDLAADSVVAFGDSILNNRQSAVDQVTGMIDLVETAMTEAVTIAELTGPDVVAALKTGLESDDEGLRLSAQGRISLAITELNKLGPAGFAAGQELLRQLGYGAVYESNYGTAVPDVRNALNNISNQFPHSEPKDPKSPLRGWTHLGGDMVRMLTDDMLGQLGTATAAARALGGALVPSVAMSGLGASPGASMPMLPSGSVGGNNITVQMIDRVEKRSVEDIGYGLKRLDDLGKLPGSRPRIPR